MHKFYLKNNLWKENIKILKLFFPQIRCYLQQVFHEGHRVMFSFLSLENIVYYYIYCLISYMIEKMDIVFH